MNYLNFADKPSSQHTSPAMENMTLREVKEKVEKDMIIAAIEKHKGNVAKAANELAISRPTLYDLLKKHNFYAASSIGKSDIP